MRKSITFLLLFALLLSVTGCLSSCAEKTCPHTTGSAWFADGEVHSRICPDCKAKVSENHTWASESSDTHTATLHQTCPYCSMERDVANDEFDAWQERFDSLRYPWETTELTMSVCDESSGGELESGGKAFVSGEWSLETMRVNQTISSVDAGILKQIINRNTQALSATKTDLTYVYQTDGGWGKTLPLIQTSTASSNTPDIWYDIIYDMVGASINGYFCNIQDNEYLGCFWDEYDEAKNSRGYSFEYMKGLSFSNKIMYLIGSDYSFDLSRAYLIMPVSIKLLGNATQVTGDVDGDGEVGSVDDFYALISAGNWTWSKILEYTDAVKKADSKKGGYAALDSDCIAGFAMSSKGGMATTAVMYTASMTVAERTVGDDGEYVYSYPAEAPTALVNVATQMKNMIAGTEGERNQYSAPSGTSGVIIYNGNPNDILSLFTGNRVFVNSTCMLGAIEKKAYQDMWDEDKDSYGYVVAPVAKMSREAEYQTTIHNVGKVFAVSSKCEAVNAACAFINYNSVTSTDILEEYYEWVIGYGRAVTEANVELLIGMKSRLLYSHEKVVEDALGLIYGTETVNNPVGSGTTTFGNCRWHTFMLKYWNGDQMTALYNGVKDTKQAKIRQIQADFIANAQLEDAQ